MPRTLQEAAWRVYGPIDFLITLVINGGCPFVFLKLGDRIPLYVVALFFAPMCFFVAFIPTFFGYRNGVLQRNWGNGSGPLPENFPWKKIAIREGLKYAAIMEIALGAVLLALYWVSPQQKWSTLQLAVIDGLTSGLLAYFFHVNAMLRANRLGPVSPSE